MKLTTGENFTNILQAAFSYESLEAFFYLQFGFVIFFDSTKAAIRGRSNDL